MFNLTPIGSQGKSRPGTPGTSKIKDSTAKCGSQKGQGAAGLDKKRLIYRLTMLLCVRIVEYRLVIIYLHCSVTIVKVLRHGNAQIVWE